MKLTHHAHVFRTDSPKESVLAFGEENEVHDQFFDRFGIDDARRLTIDAHTKPTEATEKLFIIRADFITIEAQNALLKLLEEPPETSRFLFVLPPDVPLLDTLQSRVENISNEDEVENQVIFEDFLKLDIKDRMSIIETSMKKKDLAWQRAMKTGLIRHLARERTIPHYAELEFVSRVLLTRGASNKMLFEHAALLV